MVHCTGLVGIAPFLITVNVRIGLPAGEAASAPLAIVSNETPKLVTAPASVTGNSTFKAVVPAFPTEAVVEAVQVPNPREQVVVAVTFEGLFNPIATANCVPAAAV
jgi:hypothetical protein